MSKTYLINKFINAFHYNYVTGDMFIKFSNNIVQCPESCKEGFDEKNVITHSFTLMSGKKINQNYSYSWKTLKAAESSLNRSSGFSKIFFRTISELKKETLSRLNFTIGNEKNEVIIKMNVMLPIHYDYQSDTWDTEQIENSVHEIFQDRLREYITNIPVQRAIEIFHLIDFPIGVSDRFEYPDVEDIEWSNEHSGLTFGKMIDGLIQFNNNLQNYC